MYLLVETFVFNGKGHVQIRQISLSILEEKQPTPYRLLSNPKYGLPNIYSGGMYSDVPLKIGRIKFDPCNCKFQENKEYCWTATLQSIYQYECDARRQKTGQAPIISTSIRSKNTIIGSVKAGCFI
tara:strand:+ start:340 stop:717 length:378 start_codon:yes stop_codon:yes gene_type:complete